MKQHRSYKKYDPELKLSYEKAVDIGVSTYWTGEPCINGHLDHRYVKNRKCVHCEFETRRKRRSKVFTNEAHGAGINADVRRKIEEIKMMKEYSIDL